MKNFPRILFDTDILSLYFRQSPKITAEAQKYLRQHRVFTFSIITRFEILRGMKVKNAASQLYFFEQFCYQNEIVGVNDNIVVRAASIYADLFTRGKIIGDADILIAATALENNLAVITNNQKHFNRITGLQVLNWNK